MNAKERRLKSPFPYFGGKSRVAETVWARLGDPDNFIEPFCGSAAVLLARPTAPRIETINDADCYLANFWRATSRDPEGVAACCDWPVNETDLHSRHRWLVLSEEAAAFRQRMRTDPEYFDCRIAGWWCWGLCCWIGGGWCDASRLERDNGTRPDISDAAGRGVHRMAEQLPDISGDGGAAGRGVHASAGPKLRQPKPQQCGNGYSAGIHVKRPAIGDRSEGRGICGLVPEHHRPQLGDAYSRGRGVHGNDAAGSCQQRLAWLLDWFGRLRDRLRTARVCCGDWIRVCDSPSVTTRLGVTGVFLDPPYSTAAGRNMTLYAVESGDVAHQVREYCLERGADPRMRLALCGYEGEGHEELEAAGWEVVEWKAQGGYGNRTDKGKANAARERIWFSPHCLRPEKERLLF